MYYQYINTIKIYHLDLFPASLYNILYMTPGNITPGDILAVKILFTGTILTIITCWIVENDL